MLNLKVLPDGDHPFVVLTYWKDVAEELRSQVAEGDYVLARGSRVGWNEYHQCLELTGAELETVE